jgi:hypothetical protein
MKNGISSSLRMSSAHLDGTGDLARLRLRDHAVRVEEVLLATQSGISCTDVHIHYPHLDTRRS